MSDFVELHITLTESLSVKSRKDIMPVCDYRFSHNTPSFYRPNYKSDVDCQTHIRGIPAYFYEASSIRYFSFL